MTNRELAEILLKTPDNEVFIIDYNAPSGEDLKHVCVYNEEEGKTVISFE